MFLPFNTTRTKKLFLSDDGLFNLVHQFNVHPSAYAHASWFEPFLAPELLKTVRKTRRGEFRLSRLLLQRHDLGHKACYNFADRWWRFALLPVNVIQALVLYCGLAFMNRQIASMVDKSALDHVKESIGAQSYGFAVQRAPLVIGPKSETGPGWDGCSDIGQCARQNGARYFLSHFHDAPHAIAGRLAFKFPRTLVQHSVDNLPAEKDWQFFKRILVHEIDPRWQPLFS